MYLEHGIRLKTGFGKPGKAREFECVNLVYPVEAKEITYICRVQSAFVYVYLKIITTLKSLNAAISFRVKRLGWN